MLNKGKKPEPKEQSKDQPQAPAAPARPETPRLLRAALEVSERSSGLKGALAKVKEKTHKLSMSSQVNAHRTWAKPNIKSETTDSWHHIIQFLPALHLLFPASPVSHLQLWSRQWCWDTDSNVCQLDNFSLGFRLPRQWHSTLAFCFTVTQTPSRCSLHV